MFNLGDDSELDRFSREAAGKYSPPGEPNWEKLNAELDKVLPIEEKKRRFVFFWWLLLVMLIGGTVTYWLASKNVTKQTVATETDSKKTGNTTSVSTPSVSSEKITKSETTVTTVPQKEISIPVTSTVADPSKTVVPKKPVQQNSNILLSGIKKNNSSEKTLQVSSQKSVLPADNNAANSTTASSVAANDQSVTVVQQENVVDPKPKRENLITEKKSESGLQTIIARKEESIEPKTDTEAATPTNTGNSKDTDKKLITSPKGKGFSYSFLAGVDKSTVKLRYGYDPGYNIGLMGGYHFNSKWSVHTGVIYTQKNYKLDGADFTAPKGSPVSYYKLDLVDGYCKMWEVPLLLRYTIPKARGNSFFLSAGLSSYFMTTEDYNYYYKYLGMPVVKNTYYNSTDTHVLSIVHLSAGFSKPIGKSWDMQMEPYAKIPLGGVGFGSIELSSFGINFSLQHRQPLKK